MFEPTSKDSFKKYSDKESSRNIKARITQYGLW